jgi:hypothetical protein
MAALSPGHLHDKRSRCRAAPPQMDNVLMQSDATAPLGFVCKVRQGGANKSARTPQGPLTCAAPAPGRLAQ